MLILWETWSHCEELHEKGRGGMDKTGASMSGFRVIEEERNESLHQLTEIYIVNNVNRCNQ